MERETTHQWHVAINRHHDGQRAHTHWMYEAKDMSMEVPRLTRLFQREREGALPAVHRQCSQAQAVPVVENHLTCCLGVRCRECPELLALEAMPVEPGEIDAAKAWTCAAHIVSSGGDPLKEGYLLTVDDRMFWDNVYTNMSAQGDAR